MKNPFAARNEARPAIARQVKLIRRSRQYATYPVVPALWPSRAVRRAGPQPLKLAAPASYLVASMVARLGTTSVVFVGSDGTAYAAR